MNFSIKFDDGPLYIWGGGGGGVKIYNFKVIHLIIVYKN